MNFGWNFGFYPRDAAVAIRPSSYSDLDDVAGGSTVAAGTPLPATAGRLRLQPGASGRVTITGTAAKQGDGVLVWYEGLRDLASGFAGSPAQRRESGAGPGAPGNYAVADGSIEVALSASNPANYVYWAIVGVRP